MEGNQKAGICKCPHHKVVPLMVVLFGLTFLLGNFGILSSSFVDIVWPILVVIGGGAKLFESKCTCC